MSRTPSALELIKQRSELARSLPTIKKSRGRDGISLTGHILGSEENFRCKKGETTPSFKTKDIVIQVTDVNSAIAGNEKMNPSVTDKQEDHNTKVVMVSQETGKKELFIPHYVTIDKKPRREGESLVAEGMILKLGVDSVSGNLNIGSYVTINNVRKEGSPNDEHPYGKCQAVLCIDSQYAGPYSTTCDLETITTFPPKGTSAMAKNIRGMIIAAHDSVGTLPVHKAVDKKYTPFTVFVPSENAIFERRLPDGDESFRVPGLFDIIMHGIDGNAKFASQLSLDKLKYIPKDTEGNLLPNKTVSFFEGRITVTEDGVDPISNSPAEYTTVLQVNCYEFTPNETKLATIGDIKQFWPITNRADYNAVASLNSIDILAICENGKGPETPMNNSSDNVKRITKNIGTPYAKIWGNWFGYIQHTGLLVSKEFAKTTLRNMIHDRNILCSTAGLDKKTIDQRAKLLSKLTAPLTDVVDILVNLDTSDTLKPSLNPNNPLNKSTNSLKLLSEYEGSDVDRLISGDVDVQCIFGRTPSEDNSTDLADHILEDCLNVLFGEDYTLSKIFTDNYHYLQKPSEELYDRITGANEILLTIIFTELIFTSIKGFENGFGERKKVYGEAASNIVSSIMAKKMPKDTEKTGKYVPGNFPGLARWIWLAFTMPTTQKSTKRTISDVDGVESTKPKFVVPDL